MANRFWVGDGGGWTDTAHWSTTSGGGGGASAPISTDDAFFDANSFTIGSQVVSLGGSARTIKNIDLSAVTNSPSFIFGGATTGVEFVANGNFIGGPGVDFNLNTVIGPTTASVNLAGNGLVFSKDGIIIQAGTNATVTLQGNLSVTKSFNINGSSSFTLTFDANGFDVFAGGVEAVQITTHTITIHMGSGTWTMQSTYSGTGSGFVLGGSGAQNVTLDAGTSTLVFDVSTLGFGTQILLGTLTPTVNYTFYDIQIKGNSGFSETVYFDGGNITGNSLSFDGVPVTLKLSAGKTYTFTSSISMNGSLGNILSLLSDSAGTPSTLSTPTFSGSYIDVKDNTAAGAAIPFDDSTGGANSGGNTNWIFPDPPVASFDGTPTTGFTSLIVNFTDTSTGSPTAWAWTFGDGGTSTAQNPTHTYTSPGVYTVTLTASNGGGSSMATRTNYIAASASSLYLQTVFMVGADTNGNVQTINTGKNDDGTPIFYELVTQEIEYGNRAHLKKIANQLVIFCQFGETSKLSSTTDVQDEKPIDMSLSDRVNIGKEVQIEGHFVTFRWFGESSDVSPVFEGIYTENISDMGMTNG